MKLQPQQTCPLDSFNPCRQMGCGWFIQVAGTNYHWEEGLRCLLEADGDDTTLDVPRAACAVGRCPG